MRWTKPAAGGEYMGTRIYPASGGIVNARVRSMGPMGPIELMTAGSAVALVPFLRSPGRPRAILRPKLRLGRRHVPIVHFQHQHTESGAVNRARVRPPRFA